MNEIQTIFYSWQSDLLKETNQIAIRQSLRVAANTLESEIDDIKIEIDEATRNTTGSQNIPALIFDKISQSDIFVCDITTINGDANERYRRVPNPNVLIELGYAVSILGWKRIILLFNSHYGTFPNDLPFDIDRHRTTKFCIVDKKDKAGKNSLSKLLETAIDAIIKGNPLRPHEEATVTPEKKKRKSDVAKMKLILSSLHLETIDHFIEELPERIYAKIFDFKNYFMSIVESSTFHIYDQELLQKIIEFKNKWNESLSFGRHYGRSSSREYYSFDLPMDMFPTEEAEQDFHSATIKREEFKQAFKDIISFIRNNYLEIDIDEINKTTYEKYKNK